MYWKIQVWNSPLAEWERNGMEIKFSVSIRSSLEISGHEFKVRPFIMVLCFSLVGFNCSEAGME